MNTMRLWLSILILQTGISAGAQDAVTTAQIAAAANDGGDNCSPVILSCRGTAMQNRPAGSAEQQERDRIRFKLQERDAALAQEIQFAQEHPDVVVIHSQKDPRGQAAPQPSISKVFDDAQGDHAPQELTRSYYDRFGNRHEIVNKCWGIFC